MTVAAPKLPRVSLCRLLLWHSVFEDRTRSGDGLSFMPSQYPLARFYADRAAEEFDGKSWSWYRPDIIVTWHSDFA